MLLLLLTKATISSVKKDSTHPVKQEKQFVEILFLAAAKLN